MQKMKAGFIGFVPQGADYFETVKSYAKMGYKGLESAMGLFREGDPVENAKRVRSFGLEPLALGTRLTNGEKPDVADLIKRAKMVGVNNVVLYHIDATQWRFGMHPTKPTDTEVLNDFKIIDEVSKELAKEGIDMLFHNHDQEFLATINGVPLFWAMAAYCESLKFELDLGWVNYAGFDPATVIRQLGSRLKLLHVKDYIPGKHLHQQNENVIVPRYCAPGAGVLDLFSAFEAACELGIEWAIIEQDNQHLLTAQESVQVAYYNMKDTGFVE